MDTIIQLISLISLILYPKKVEQKLLSLKNKIYSARVSRDFKSCGKRFLCEKRIRIWHPQFIELGNKVHIFASSILAVHRNSLTSKYGHIKIGNNVVIGESTHISSANDITIGDNVLMGRRCTITDNSHGSSTASDIKIAPTKRNIVSKGKVSIGKNVWLGDNVIILPGVNIGEGCIVGASSVVTHSAPPKSVLVGNPAQIIKSL